MYLGRHNRLQAKVLRPNAGRLDYAKKMVAMALRQFSCEPVSLSHSFRSLKKETSAGLFYDGEDFRKLHSDKTDVKYYEIKREIKRWKRKGYIDNPSSIAFRSHLARGEAHKSRVVYVTPYPVICLEGQFTIPLIDQIKASAYDCPFGTQHNWLAGGFRHFKAAHSRGIPVSLDFSAFDMSVQEEIILLAFDLLRPIFRLSGNHKDEWAMIVEYFINTKVRHGGRDYMVRGGVPSGSAWTHIIGSTISMLLAYYCFGSNALSLKCYGDDLCVFCRQKPSLQEICYWAGTLGFEISLEKSVIGEIHWLGFNITGKYPRILDPIKRWAAFFHPDRPDETMAHHKGRLIGYVLSSLGDPAFLDDAMAVLESIPGAWILPENLVSPEFQDVLLSDVKLISTVFRNVL